MAKVALIEYLVRIMPPDTVEISIKDENEMMDEALSAIEATLGGGRLQRLINERFVRSVDSLGNKGFTVEVVTPDNWTKKGD